MRFTRIAPLIAAGILALILTGLSGCGSGNSVGPSGNSTTRVRTFNALQNCPAGVDFTQTGLAATSTNVAYGAAPTGGYQSIRAGNGLNYNVFQTGTTTTPIATASVDLGPHDANSTNNTGTYTLVATGICGGGSGITTPHLVRLVDSFPSVFTGTTAGTAAFRIINLVPDANGGLTLFSNGAPLANTGTDITGTSNVVYAGTGGFNGSHYTQGITLNTTPTFTIVDSSNAVLATVPSTFTFQPNHAYTLFVIGEVHPTAGGQPVTVVPVQDFP